MTNPTPNAETRRTEDAGSSPPEVFSDPPLLRLREALEKIAEFPFTGRIAEQQMRLLAREAYSLPTLKSAEADKTEFQSSDGGVEKQS